MTKRIQNIVMMMLLLFAAGVGKAWGDDVVTSLNHIGTTAITAPTSGHYYVIKCNGQASQVTYMYDNKGSVAATTNLPTGTSGLPYVWKIVQNDDNTTYTITNASTGKSLTFEGTSNGSTVSTSATGTAITIAVSGSNVALANSSSQYIDMSYSGTSPTTWSGGVSGSRAMTLYEVSYEVIYNYTYNGASCGSETFYVGVVGSTYPNPAISLKADASLLNYGIPTGTVTADGTYDVPITLGTAFPFIPTTISDGKFADNTVYYKMTLKGAYAYYDATNSKFPTASSFGKSDEYLFAFTGDPVNGFQIYNKALGTESAVYSNSPDDNGTAISPNDSPSGTWSVGVNTKGGYWMLESDGTNSYMNSRGSALSFWQSTAATSDVGSNLTFEGVDLYTYEITGNGANAVTVTYTGSTNTFSTNTYVAVPHGDEVTKDKLSITDIPCFSKTVEVNTTAKTITVTYTYTTPKTYYITSNYTSLTSGTHAGEHVAIQDNGNGTLQWNVINGQAQKNLWLMEYDATAGGFTFKNVATGNYMAAVSGGNFSVGTTALAFTMNQLATDHYTFVNGTNYLHARILQEYCDGNTSYQSPPYAVMNVTSASQGAANDWKLYDASNLTIYTVNITAPAGTGTPSVTYNGTDLFPDESATKTNGQTLFFASTTAPTSDQFSSDITGYRATITVDETAKTINVTYTALDQYAYRLIGAKGAADETSSTADVKENFWLDIKTGATAPAAEVGNASINNIAQAVILYSGTNGVYLENADGGYVNKGSNAWSAKITSTATTEWTVAETGTGTGLYTFQQYGYGVTEGYLYKGNYFTSGNALYINGEAGLTWKRYEWNKVHTLSKASNIEDGMITPSTTDGGQAVNGFGSYVEGETITLTFAADFPYNKVVVKDASGNEITVTDNKFTMPAGDVTISAYNDYTLTITKPDAVSADDIPSITVKGGTASPYAYSATAQTVSTTEQTLSTTDITAPSISLDDGTMYVAAVTVDNSSKTINVAYQDDAYLVEYSLVLNNAPSGATVKITNTKNTDMYNTGYTQNCTVLSKTTSLADSDVTTSNDDTDSDGNSDRHAVLVDNDARTISVTYLGSTQYIVEVTGLTDNTAGSLVYNKKRYVNGSTFDTSTISDYDASLLAGDAITNYDATVTVDDTKAKIKVAYSITEGLDPVTITYNIYYEGTKYTSLPVSATIGQPYPHIDGTSNKDVTDGDGNITTHYGEVTGNSYLPYGVYAAYYDGSSLVYDVYPEGLVTESKTVDLNVKYVQSVLPFQAEGTRFSKITDWYAMSIGANGAKAAAAGKTLGTLDATETADIKNYYLRAQNNTLYVDESTAVLDEYEFDSEPDNYQKITAKQPQYYWVMIGNPFHFRLMNRAMGAGKYLKYNVENATTGGGYFSFDDEGTYFTFVTNYSVPAGSYGTHDSAHKPDGYSGAMPSVIGCTMLLSDSLYNGSSMPPYYGIGLASATSTNVTVTKATVMTVSSTITNNPLFNTYFSYITSKTDPVAVTYTVRVVVPSGNTVVGGIQDGNNTYHDGETMSFTSEPDPDNMNSIDVDGYDAVISIDNANRNIFVTYIKNTDFTDLYYVRNRGTWNGYFMGDDDDASATADPRSADHIRLLPAGTVSAYMNGANVDLPTFNVYGRTSSGDVYIWNDMTATDVTSQRERYVLYDSDGNVLDYNTNYMPQLDESKTYMFIDAYNIAQGEMYVLKFDNNPYSASGCPLVTEAHSTQVRKEGQWQFTKYEEPTAITVSTQTVTSVATTETYTDGYVTWNGNKIKNGEKIYVLSTDEDEVTGLTIPVIDNGSYKKLYCKRYSLSDRNYNVIWMDLNVISDEASLQTAVTEGKSFYLVNADGHGIMVRDADRDADRPVISGAFTIAGTEIASPLYSQPISVFDINNMWNITLNATTGKYALINHSSNQYLTGGTDDTPHLTDAETYMSTLEFNSDGTVSFVARSGVTSRVGAVITDADDPLQLLANSNTDSHWYLLSPSRQYESTIVTNQENGGVTMNVSGDVYQNGDKIVYILPLSHYGSSTLSKILTILPVSSFTGSFRTDATTNTVYIDYSAQLGESHKYLAIPSIDSSPWSPYSAAVITVNGTETVGAKFNTSADTSAGQDAQWSFVDVGTYGTDREAKPLPTQFWDGTWPYTGEGVLTTSSTDLTTYCTAIDIDDSWQTAHIKINDKGYLYALGSDLTLMQKAGAKDLVQFGFTNDVNLAERFLLIRGDQIYQKQFGYDQSYTTEYFIMPESSLGHLGKNPSNYWGQLVLGYNGFDAEEEYPLGLTSMANISRLNEDVGTVKAHDADGNNIGAVNRRHCFAFMLEATDKEVYYTVSVTGLPSSYSDTEVANMDGAVIKPSTTSLTNYLLDKIDFRVKPIDGYHYNFTLTDNAINIDYVACERVTDFSQLKVGQAYTLRSKTDCGYVAYDVNWQINPVANAYSFMTLWGSWDPNYRFQTEPADYTTSNARWGFVPISISSDGNTMTAYMGNFTNYLMVTGDATHAWSLTKDQVKPITIKKCSDGTFKLMSTTSGGTEYWLHAPNKGSKSYGWLGNPTFTSSEEGAYLSEYDRDNSTGRSDITGETNEDAVKWIIETTEFSAASPVYTVTLEGIDKESEISATCGLDIQISANSLLQSTLTADNFTAADYYTEDGHTDNNFSAQTVLAYEASDLSVSSVTAPEGYEYVSSSINGRDIVLTFKEKFEHLLARAKDLYKAGKKKYGEGDASTTLTVTDVADDSDDYTSATRAAEDAHKNIYYGYPDETIYATLRTAICTAVASSKTSDDWTALNSAIETFYSDAQSMDNINIPDEDAVVRLINASTGRRVEFSTEELSENEYANWSTTEHQMGQIFVMKHDPDYPDDASRFLAYNALGHTTKVQAQSVYAMGHEEMQDANSDAEKALGYVGAMYCTNPDYGLAMSDPYIKYSITATSRLYLWGMGTLASYGIPEKAADAPNLKFNYLRVVDADVEYGNDYTIFDIVVTGIPEGETEKPIDLYYITGGTAPDNITSSVYYNSIYNGGFAPIPNSNGIGTKTDDTHYLNLFTVDIPEYGNYVKATATMDIKLPTERGTDADGNAYTRGLITFAYSMPADYYWNQFSSYLNSTAVSALYKNSILTADMTKTSGLEEASVAAKGYGYPVNSVNQTFLDQIKAMGVFMNDYNKKPDADGGGTDGNTSWAYSTTATKYRSQFTYDIYNTQKGILDQYLSDYLNTTDVKMPEAGDIIGIRGVGGTSDSPYYNVGTRSGNSYIVEDCQYDADGNPIAVDATRKSGTLESGYEFNYNNNHFWIVESGSATGSVYFKSAYCNGTYASWAHPITGSASDKWAGLELATEPVEWYFTRGTELGYLSIYFRTGSVSAYATTTADHQMTAYTSRVHNAAITTDYVITDAKCVLYDFDVITPSSYTGDAPKITLADATYVAYSPLTDGGQMVFPDPAKADIVEFTTDVVDQSFAPQEIPGYSHSNAIDLVNDIITITYVEDVNTVKVRANNWLENLKLVTAVFGDYTQDGSAYKTAYNAVNASDATTESINAAMKTFFNAGTGTTITFQNEATSDYLGTVSGSNKGGTYLGTSSSRSTENQYQLMYDGDGSTPYYTLYNMGYGNYVGKANTTTSRMTSSTTKDNAGLYLITTTAENKIYLTCENGSLATTEATLGEKSTTEHTIFAGQYKNDPLQHWNVATVKNTLPIPGNYYYVQTSSNSYIYQDKSNGESYSEDNTSNANNPAAIFTVTRSGSKYVVRNLAGGYLASDGSVVDTEQKLTADNLSSLKFTQITDKSDDYYSLLELYYDASQYPIGKTVGTYVNGAGTLGLTGAADKDGNATTDTKSLVRTALGSTESDITTALTTLQTSIDALELNMPSSTFYRIKSKASGKYLTMEGGVNEANMKLLGYSSDQLVASEAKSAYTIFWLQNKEQNASASDPAYSDASGNPQYKLLGYSNGQYMQNTFLLTSAAYQSSASKFVFEKGNSLGAYAIKSDAADNKIIYLYANANSTQVSSSDVKNVTDTDWELEEVTEIPVTIGTTGYATLHLPVAATIPSGLTVGWGSAITTASTSAMPGAVGKVTLTTLATGDGGTLPAFTPVIIYNSSATYTTKTVTLADKSTVSVDTTKVQTFVFSLDTSGATSEQLVQHTSNNVLMGTYSTQTQDDWFGMYLNGTENLYSDVYVLMRGKVTVSGSTTYPVGFFGDYIGTLTGFRAVLPKQKDNSYGTSTASGRGEGGTTAAKGFVFEWEGLNDIDGIAPVSSNALLDADTPYYNLSGVNMGNDLHNLPAGVYIHNGQKVYKKH